MLSLKHKECFKWLSCGEKDGRFPAASLPTKSKAKMSRSNESRRSPRLTGLEERDFNKFQTQFIPYANKVKNYRLIYLGVTGDATVEELILKDKPLDEEGIYEPDLKEGIYEPN